MIRYRFISEGSFRVPAARVWAIFEDMKSIPQWWPGVKSAGIRGGGKRIQKGSLIDVTVKGLLGDLSFTLEVTGIKPHKELYLKSCGDLEGYGLWTLEEEDGITRTCYTWEVVTTGWLMNLAGLFLKPFLAWNHNRVMAAGYKNLRSRIEHQA